MDIKVVLTIVGVVLFLAAAVSFYRSMRNFTVGYFKEFNKIVWASIVLILVSQLTRITLGEPFAELLEESLEVVAALLFIYAAWKLRVMSEQFGFAKLDVSAPRKQAAKKFVSIMMKAKKR